MVLSNKKIISPSYHNQIKEIRRIVVVHSTVELKWYSTSTPKYSYIPKMYTARFLSRWVLCICFFSSGPDLILSIIKDVKEMFRNYT